MRVSRSKPPKPENGNRHWQYCHKKRSKDDLNSDPRGLRLGACAYMNYSGRFECSMSRKIAVASPHHEAGDDGDVAGTAP